MTDNVLLEGAVRQHTEDQFAPLENAGVRDLKIYREKLAQSSRDPSRLLDLLCEGRAALMFSQHSWRVEIRDAPDLELELDREILYAEVKHFRRKKQDDIDESKMSQVLDELVLGKFKLTRVDFTKPKKGAFARPSMHLLI
jgi:hypothetical protein